MISRFNISAHCTFNPPITKFLQIFWYSAPFQARKAAELRNICRNIVNTLTEGAAHRNIGLNSLGLFELIQVISWSFAGLVFKNTVEGRFGVKTTLLSDGDKREFGIRFIFHAPFYLFNAVFVDKI